MSETETKTHIHPTAIIDPSAKIGNNVEIGPFTVIHDNVIIGDGTKIESHVIIKPYTHIGANNVIMNGAALGGTPQDHGFKGEISYLKIGDNNVIREYVTLHRASGEGESTMIGNNNMLMAYCHIGHNCVLGNKITMANTVGVSGHAIIEDNVVFGGMAGIHQKLRIGKLSMVGGFSKVVQDVPPFSMTDGHPARVIDLNVIGLRRNGVSSKSRSDLKQAYKILYRSNLNTSQALEAIQDELELSPELEYLIDFISNIREGTRGRQLEKPRK